MNPKQAKAWVRKYGLGGDAGRAITAKKQPGKISEDDPRWNPRTMGNKRAGTRRAPGAPGDVNRRRRPPKFTSNSRWD